MGSPPFQKHLSPLFCVLHCLGFCICAQRVNKKKKNRQRLRRKKKKKKRYRTTLSASRILSLLSLSLSAFIKPLLWKKANPKRSSEEEEEEEEEEEGVRRRRRLRRPFRFVERRRKSARERILFCVVGVCGRIQIQTRESKRYPGIRIFRWRLYRSSDSGAWGHVLCAARRLFFVCVRFKTREKKKRWVRRGLVAMVIVGIADDAWHRRR